MKDLFAKKKVWGPYIDHRNQTGSSEQRKCMEKPLVSMISRMIRAKASVPHDIIHEKLAAPKLFIEALARSISFLHNTWSLPIDTYARLPLESSQHLVSQEDSYCLYAQLTSWFQLHGLDKDRLSPFKLF